MENRINHAVHAAVAGITLGAPRIGRTQYQKLNGFDPIPSRMAASPLLDSWIVWAKALTENKPPHQLGQFLLENLYDQTDETAFGLMNLRRGLSAPISGSLDNPLSDGSRALFRAIFWGLTHRNQPELAGTYAFYDSSIDHSGEGVWIPAAFAYAVSVSWDGMSANEFWEAVSSALPPHSELHRVGPHLLTNVEHTESPQEFANQFSRRFPALDRKGIVATASFVLLGLLNARQNPQNAGLISAGCGGQADIVTACSLAIAVNLWEPLDSNFLEPLGKDYIGTHALRHITPPPTITEFAESVKNAAPPEPVIVEPITEEPVVEVTAALEPDSEETAPVETESVTQNNEDPVTEPAEVETQEEPIPETPVFINQVPTYPSSLSKLISSEPNYFVIDLKGIEVTVHYFDEPVGIEPVRKLQIVIKNVAADPNFQLSLSCPPEWQLAHKVGDARIEVGAEVQFPIVLKPGIKPILNPQLQLLVNQMSVLIPFIKPQSYWILGPFVNIEGNGFIYTHSPEKVDQKIQTWDAPFAGRSDIGIRWANYYSSGIQFDVEPIFNQGAGVTYLYAHVQWEQAGALRVMGQFAGGLKIWIDSKEVLSYNDTTQKTVRLGESTTADFMTQGESHILIKVTRGKDPVTPLQLAFFDETGKVIFPVQFLNQI